MISDPRILSSKMVLKRKHVACIDPKKTNVLKKAPTKADVIEEMKLIKQLNAALEEEVHKNEERIAILEKDEKKHLDAIKQLESKTEKLNEKETKSNDAKDIGCQTELDEPIFCYECDFPAEDFHDLGEHMVEYHSEKCSICGDRFDSKETVANHAMDHSKECNVQRVPAGSMQCNFCEENFQTKRDLMQHKKTKHIEKVSTCWKYTLGTCHFGDLSCWFQHNDETSSSKNKCDDCDKSFSTKPEYFQHRKINHSTKVSICKNNVKSECSFGETACWFIHEQKINESDEKSEVMQKLLEIMEKMTKRISALEQSH